MGEVSEVEAVDLAAIEAKWLQQCGPCDGGLPMGCSHPNEDYRPTLALLVAEVERLRAALGAPACACPTDNYCPRCHPRWYANWRARQDRAPITTTHPTASAGLAGSEGERDE